MQDLGASVPYTADQCETQLGALEKQNRERRQETNLSSQSRPSDPRHSRKRRRLDTPPAGK